ncbi:MAG: ABC transporter permease [Candidatus Rokubacteria bacterium]|nr:ABC transporter permease [Candidatus Rokubacteria bacterium]MBI3107927.1 ABC transporter permease [Candidatus Rokubacteria bacterium]
MVAQPERAVPAAGQMPLVGRRAGPWGGRARLALANVVTLVGVLLLWQLVAVIYASPFVPSPAAVWRAALRLAAVGDVNGHSLLAHTGQSLLRVLAGFAAAAVMGVPLGLVMGLYPRIYQSTKSVIEPIRFIPPLAWIPIAIVTLSGFSRYVFIIWLGAFFPVFIATLVGVPRVEILHKNVAAVHGAGRAYILRKVVIPSTLPDILGGMRVGLGVGWMCIVAAEMIGGEMLGLGKLILKYAELLRMAEIVVGMIIIGLCGLVMNEILLAIEKRLFRWRWEVTL